MARLVVYFDRNKIGHYDFEEGRIQVGRHPDSDIFLPHPSVSRQHIALVKEGETWTVENAGGQNAIFVNGSVMKTSALLSDEDRIEIGRYILRFIRDPEADLGADPMIGRLFGGRYKAHSKLGEGAFGAVYKGVQVNLSQPVAIKVLKAELSENEVTVQRFYNEAQIYAQIGHPHVVKIHDFGQDPWDPTLYLVMEFLEGKDLDQLLREDGPLPADRLMLLATQILQGLDAAHRLGIIHRDLKPANVLVLNPDSERPFAKLVDFGISKQAEGAEEEYLPDDPLAETFRQGLTRAGKFTGSPAYMSPEQCYGHTLDARSDLYSMGVLLYEVACGHVPFTAPSLFSLLKKHTTEAPPPLQEHHPDLRFPKKLEALILRCLEKSALDRYQSAEEMLEAIEAVQREEPDLMSAILEGIKTAPNTQGPNGMDATVSQEATLPVSDSDSGAEATQVDESLLLAAGGELHDLEEFASHSSANMAARSEVTASAAAPKPTGEEGGESTKRFTLGKLRALRSRAAKLYRPHLLWIEDGRERLSNLTDPPIFIGSGKDAGVRIPGGFLVAGEHARIVVREDAEKSRYEISPCSWFGKLLVNDEPVRHAFTLSDGDKIQIGQTEMEFRISMFEEE